MYSRLKPRSPLPWRIEKGRDDSAHILDANRRPLTRWGDLDSDIDYIICACNAHPAMQAALEECLSYFEDREDVLDGTDGQPRPNEAMRLASTIREALGRGCV
jgi:hypothetical protein